MPTPPAMRLSPFRSVVRDSAAPVVCVASALVSWCWWVTITSLTWTGVRQTECSLVMEGRSIARVAAPTPEKARTVAWANQARIWQGRADAHAGGSHGATGYLLVSISMPVSGPCRGD